MFFWYIGLSVFGVATIFRSVGIDYRLIAVGSLLPLVLDLGFGYRAYGYTLLFAVALLAIVMVGTIGRPRLVRRRWLCLPIGVFCGLILSGAFANTELFWWPFLGNDFTHDALLPDVVGRGDRGGRRAVRVLGGRRPVRPLPARPPRGVLPHRPPHDCEHLKVDVRWRTRTLRCSWRGSVTRRGRGCRRARASGLGRAGVGAVGVDDEAALAGAVGDGHARAPRAARGPPRADGRST